MNKTKKEEYELPEICYDEPLPGHAPNKFPFIMVKEGKKLSPVLFIEERRETGEVEPGPNGEPQEIIDCIMQKFVNMEVLKEKLPAAINDMVRVALGMEPLKAAKKKGAIIQEKAAKNVEILKERMGK